MQELSNLVERDSKYRRVLLKISGEALMADREFGLDPTMVAQRGIGNKIGKLFGS